MNPTEQFALPRKYQLKTWQITLLVIAGSFLFVVILLSVLRLAYQGRFLPGVKVYGVYVGGLTKEEAQTLLEKETYQYIESSTIVVNGENTEAKVSIPASEVELQYAIEDDLAEAYQQGREGQILQQLSDQVMLIAGAPITDDATVTYNTAKLYTIIQPLLKEMATPAQNASYTVNEQGELVITPEQAGTRMNLTQFIDDYSAIARTLQRSAITTRSNSQSAAVLADALKDRQNNLEVFVRQPMTLTFESKTWTVPTQELLSWLSYSDGTMPLRQDLVSNYYQQQANSLMQVDLDTARIKSYLSSVAKDINQKAVDATLTVEGDRATVFQQSQDGRAVDLDMTAKTISENILAAQPSYTIPLTVVVTKADVTSDTIDQLGIKELLSEGMSYFPGSSANRLTNVRVGAKRYNGVLLKPGQIFSFGELLGKVGPEQGYKEGRVILEGRTESQYGGGLCQVSSTAFRAALLAGLPILERYNHSFAVEYYTAPYGVPGVDATIYYPQVDFKFRNDTANHILIQTEMVGTTLKFRFYGTKEKTGVIRGPYFISGSNDATQPSKTVFYRDIVVNGQVSKTSTFYTTYRSSLDFPPVD